ncbi:DUF1428 domain-containing protein [Sphingomonas sp. PB4P5]|uniref:DUF1428 domain-containing protein n=1 Tax=Parasphingomonas puruogangriensis TaxID=3096155 RepID=UPI003FA6E30E
MSYIQGFVLAAPSANKQAYVEHAAKAVAIFREFGMTRMVETWGDDVPVGKLNDFRTAVQAKDDETVLFSWCEWPSREVYQAGMKRMMEDPRMAEMGEMPFDGRRMIFAGFAPEIDTGPGGATGYVDGFLIPVAPDKKQAYFDMARHVAPAFLENGATRLVEAWGDDVPAGEVTDFFRAVHATEGENVVFSWVEWPDKAIRDAGMKQVAQQTPPTDMPFDGQRMIFGGFAPILDR